MNTGLFVTRLMIGSEMFGSPAMAFLKYSRSPKLPLALGSSP